MKKRAERIVGVDYGLARIGLALSDELKMIASPLETMQAERKQELTAAKLASFLDKAQQAGNYTITALVLGLPLRMDGTYGPSADEVKQFSEALKLLVPYPIILWDERLTTAQAERSLREGSLTRKRRAQVVDRVAAVIILQSYLDSQQVG